MNAAAYPLSWPTTFPRAAQREKGKFQTTLAGALKNVQHSLHMFAKDSETELQGLVISSNVTLGVQRPDDQGVAVWFTWGGLRVCIAVDRYQTVEGNLQAIHHIIEARRVELRHGTLALVRATFQGFLALPAPTGGGQKRHWRDVLEYGNSPADREAITQHYRILAKTAHPDKGGTDARMAELNQARDDALKECS